MIVEFEVMMIWPGVYLLTVTMVDAPSVQLGIFGSVEDIDEACEQFLAEHQRQVHYRQGRLFFDCSRMGIHLQLLGS